MSETGIATFKKNKMISVRKPHLDFIKWLPVIRKNLPPRAFLLPLFALGGCATIVDGSTQQISLNTTPSSANCDIYREGLKIGEVPSTPGAALIQKTRQDLTISCAKTGYQQATYVNRSGLDGATFGNILLGGLIGLGIDMATGSDNKYDSQVNVTLVPEPMSPNVPTSQAPQSSPDSPPSS